MVGHIWGNYMLHTEKIEVYAKQCLRFYLLVTTDSLLVLVPSMQSRLHYVL